MHSWGMHFSGGMAPAAAAAAAQWQRRREVADVQEAVRLSPWQQGGLLLAVVAAGVQPLPLLRLPLQPPPMAPPLALAARVRFPTL